ncbi:MAG: hypothetical protein ACYSR9_06475 [Planctomycetota bacterium]|jgi:hypothetical protein
MISAKQCIYEISLEILRIIAIIEYYHQDNTIIWMGWELTTIIGERA